LALSATLARTSRIIEQRGLDNAKVEISMTYTFYSDARSRVRSNLRASTGHNNDEAIQYVADAVAACEKAQSTTPFKWNTGTKTSVIGLNSVKPDKYTVVASYTLVADGVYCDYDPIKKKADIGSNFLERE